ncbi:MAG: right-handed parallel beta-helix repeat-containing protein [Paludibacter sp.]|nr:right-handed parallel beta-helix repeat-containing protein [Paludibacter sp.]
MKNKFLFIAILFIAFFFNQEIKSQNSYYVSNAGSDNNVGSITSPWKTIQKALNTIQAGEIAYVRAGIYNETVTFKKSGTLGNYVSLMAYSDEKPIIEGLNLGSWILVDLNNQSYVRISGFTIQNGTIGISNGKSNVIIENNYVLNFTNPGISLNNCSNSIVRGNVADNTCSNSWGECITFSQCEYIDVISNEVKNGNVNPHGGEGLDIKSSKHMRVYGNSIHDLKKLGLYIDAYDGLDYDIEVFNNKVYNCNEGIIVSSEERNAVEKVFIHNNIIYDCLNTGIGIVNWPTHPDGTLYPVNDIEIENNTITCKNPIYIDAKFGSNIIVRNNILFNYYPVNYGSKPAGILLENNLSNQGSVSVLGSGSIISDPLFINSSLKDFHLKMNSPAIDKGVSNNVGFDYNFAARPFGSSNDIGAYEYGSTTLVELTQKKKPKFNTLLARINQDKDDGYENVSTKEVNINSVSLTSSFTSTTNKEIAALRFSNIAIPQGATIINAKLILRASAFTNCDNDPIQIRAEKCSNSSELTTNSGSISDKIRTVNYSNWLPGTSSTGNYKTTSSLDFIVSEIVSDAEWISGNAITFLLEFTSTADAGRSFVFNSFESGNSYSPQLYIEYITGETNAIKETPLLNGKSIEIYPNPIKNSTISITNHGVSGVKNICIYDLSGHMFLDKNLHDYENQTINIEGSISSGVYIARIFTDEGNFSQLLLIKERIDN